MSTTINFARCGGKLPRISYHIFMMLVVVSQHLLATTDAQRNDALLVGNQRQVLPCAYVQNLGVPYVRQSGGGRGDESSGGRCVVQSGDSTAERRRAQDILSGAVSTADRSTAAGSAGMSRRRKRVMKNGKGGRRGRL